MDPVIKLKERKSIEPIDISEEDFASSSFGGGG